MRKCWTTAFSPLPTIFVKDFSLFKKGIFFSKGFIEIRPIVLFLSIKSQLIIFLKTIRNVYRFIDKIKRWPNLHPLTLSQTTNFRLFQIERVCRPQFQIWWKWQNVLQTSKQLWKTEITLYEQFLLFPSVFNRLVLQKSKNHGLFRKVLRIILQTHWWLWQCFAVDIIFWKTVWWLETRGAWAPVSLHRPDISTMAEEVFNNYHSIPAF